MRRRLRAEGGQTSVEYLGVVVVVAVIVAGLATAAPGVADLLSSRLGRTTQVRHVTKPKHHGGGPWRSITNAAGATGSFVGDVGTGAYDGVKGTLEMGWKLSPVRGLVDPDGVARDARAFDQAIWHGITHPAELGKALIDWEDLTGGHPGKAVGQWLPEIAIAFFTAGLGTGADGGVEAARDLSRVEKAAEAARATERELTIAGERATLHGAERLTQAGFDEAAIAATKSGRVLQQADGATVYLNEVSPGRYDFIVQGDRGVITAHRGWSHKAVERLAKNYGWQGWP